MAAAASIPNLATNIIGSFILSLLFYGVVYKCIVNKLNQYLGVRLPKMIKNHIVLCTYKS